MLFDGALGGVVAAAAAASSRRAARMPYFTTMLGAKIIEPMMRVTPLTKCIDSVKKDPNPTKNVTIEIPHMP